jgi:hypothetical protein
MNLVSASLSASFVGAIQQKSMNGKFFIGIGVSRPRGMDLLPGVQNSIDSMVSWAIQQGYSSETITDGDGPVTADRIRQIIAPILGNQIDLLLGLGPARARTARSQDGARKAGCRTCYFHGSKNEIFAMAFL